MDSNETITDEAASLWPEMSSDITSARTVARSITLDTQRASTDGRVLELSSQLQAINARMLELEARIATGHVGEGGQDSARNEALEHDVANLRELMVGLTARVDEQSLAPVSSTDGPSSEALLSIDSRLSAAEATRTRDSEEVNQLMAYLEQAFRRLDELSERLATNEEGLRTQVGDAESKLASQVGEVRSLLEGQVADVERNLAADVAEARTQLELQVQQAEERINTALETMPATGVDSEVTDGLHGRIDELHQKLGELPEPGVSSDITDGLHGRIDELHQKLDELPEPGVSSDITDALHGRIDELHTVFGDELRNLTGSLPDQAASEQQTSELGARVDDMNARVDNSHSRIDEVEQRAAERTEGLLGRVEAAESTLADLTNLAERMERAESQLQDTVDLREHLETGNARIDELNNELDTRLEASEDRLAERIKEARELLAAQQAESTTSLTEMIDLSEQSLASQVSTVEEELAAQVAEARELLTAKAADDSTANALAAMEEKVSGLDDQVSNATSMAIESQHFSENLRVLQTDLVKAIQVELEGQAVRLEDVESSITTAKDDQGTEQTRLVDRITTAEAHHGTTDARLEHLETTIVSLAAKPSGDLGLAPANPLDAQRLALVETRLEESSASIENLAQLQQRTAGQESNLSESVAAMAAALEQNSQELSSLRGQLDQAHARISQLESGVGSPGASPEEPQVSPDPEPAPAVDPQPVPEPRADALRVADVIGETTKEERLTPKDGSDWFVASYAKKDKSRGRFRR